MELTWWQIVLGVIVGLILLMVLVILHELGHAWAAVRNGVKVEEFGLGFPPRAKILGKFRGTLITLNWLLPLGGFCKMKGESDDARENGSYGAASFWAKTKILFAGVVMNLLAAMVIFTILAWTGLPRISADQFAIASDNHGRTGIVDVANVVDGSPAAKAGLQKGDEILTLVGAECLSELELSVNCAPLYDPLSSHESATHIQDSSQVSDFTKKHAGETITIKFSRGGQTKFATAKLNSAQDAAKSGYLGVAMTQKQSATIRATWSAPLVGIVDTLQFVWMTLQGLAGLIANLAQGLAGLVMQSPGASAELSAAGDSVAGPVGILGVIFPNALMAGPTQLFFLMGIISLTLTIMNILPIPGLDGGRWYLTAWYRARRKPLSKEKEEKIVGWGMLVLFGLIIIITITDIWKLF